MRSCYQLLYRLSSQKILALYCDLSVKSYRRGNYCKLSHIKKDISNNSRRRQNVVCMIRNLQMLISRTTDFQNSSFIYM